MKRILLKLSGEGLSNSEINLAIDSNIVEKLVLQIKELVQREYQIGIVVGGGNFWRGASAAKNGISRNRADYIGMLATIMNALALQSAFETNGVIAHVQSSLNVDAKVAQPYINEIAINSLSKGEVIIFAGGTGRPYFTTDSASTLLASEIGADMVLMAKNGVDGVYDKDPRTHDDAKLLENISYRDILDKNIQIMDLTAATMAMENNLEMIVFNINHPNAIVDVVDKKIFHTTIKKREQ